jgi:LCP family protein required for cell wall assembly
LERDIPNTDRTAARAARTEVATQRHINPLLIAGIAVFAALSSYLALVVATHMDDTLLPGNEISVSIVPGTDAEERPDVVTPEDRINILVMGLDLRRDEDPDIPARTDTVFVFTIDPWSKTAGVLSIPRDTAVDIPVDLESEAYFSDRINTAYVYGENQERGDGPKYAVKAVERFLDSDYYDDKTDVPINYYAVLNFNNFIEIVDELGGIDVNVPEYVWDPEYSDCNSCGAYYVEFDEGPQHMDGERALTYARLRHSDNDFKRIERQQLVMRSIARKASDIGVLAGSNPRNLFDAYKDSVKTNVSDLKVPGLAILGSQVGVDNIVMESLSEAVYPCPFSQCNGAAMLLPLPAKVEEVKARVFGDGRLQQERALIKIVNGTPTPKLGETFAAYLRSQGVASDRITVDEYANGDLFEQTLVIDHRDHAYTTGRIAEFLGFGEERIFKYPNLAVETQARFRDDLVGITVVLGSDATVPEAPISVSDYAEEEESYYYSEDEGTDSTEYVPEETAAPEPLPEPVPEPTVEPAPEPVPEPVPEPPPEPPPETPPPEGG